MKELKKAVSLTNGSISWFKRDGYIDCRRTPESGINIVGSLEEFIDARFNRECWDIPQLNKLCDLLDGHAFECQLIGSDEERKRYDLAVFTLVSPDRIENPSEDLIELINSAREWLGGDQITFNCLKVKTNIIIKNSNEEEQLEDSE